jgi:ribonuclease HI
MSFYAVARGHQIGIFNTWNECKMNTQGYKAAAFKKFSTRDEAENFIADNEKTDIYKTTFDPDYYVYTDGSCSNNGRVNAMAGIGIYFGENDPRNVSERVSGKQSNNTGELGAIIRLYDIIQEDIASGKKIGVISDSVYAIRCVTTYGKKCEEGAWKGEVPNKEMVKKVYELYKGKSNVRFMHVMAHTGKTDRHSVGNDGADRLANEAIGLH